MESRCVADSGCAWQIKQKTTAVTRTHQQKILHLNSCTEAVQLDDYAEFVVSTANQLQAEKLQNIEDIFAAGDLSQNGIITSSELRTLYRILGNQFSGDTNLQMQEVKKLFDEYAEVHQGVPKGKETVRLKGISYLNFERMCLEKDVFTIRA